MCIIRVRLQCVSPMLYFAASGVTIEDTSTSRTLELSVLIVSLVVWKKRSRCSKCTCKEIVWYEERAHSRANCHASKISQCTTSDTFEDIIWQRIWLNCSLACFFHYLNLVINLISSFSKYYTRGVFKFNISHLSLTFS